ncbi:MAG: NAD-dependent epimerase/dehydratase family protein [Candidatus Manganitrophus sp. SB1]|nr:NAD-dependent epimerase/dehydratase family protein [Candidatus Manganitrophus morganii]
MAKVLVTGASGFIGKHLVSKLLADQHDVIKVSSASGDIAEKTTWSSLQAAEVVIHLAGKTFVPDSWKDPAGFLKTNLYGTMGALDYCRQFHARLVFLSSYLYGNPEKLPIPESASLKANNPYALSKKLAEEVCEFYANHFGIKATILRPFNVYGPGQADSFLIPSIVNQVNAGDIVRIKDLEPKRDYIYIDDLVDAIIKAVNLDRAFSILNVGTGVSHSVADIIDLIQEIKGTSWVVQSACERRPEEIMDTRADITKVSEVLKWTPKWSLRSGLEKVLSEAYVS